MPWGHAANRGTRRLCRHLFGERADELDKVWVLRGVGVDYDLCCADCARDGGRPELALACEGCAARADGDRLSVVGVIGEPEIRRRPEPVTGTLTRSPRMGLAPGGRAPRVGDPPVAARIRRSCCEAKSPHDLVVRGEASPSRNVNHLDRERAA